MVAERENSALAQQLIATAIRRLGLEKSNLIIHNDRGAPMTANSFQTLLESLGVTPSLSRPRVSNDNPFSESHFKTLKYQPEYPGRFAHIDEARQFVRRFMTWYDTEHRHTGLRGFTPEEVYSGRYHILAEQRQAVLDCAFQAHPSRWINGPPRLPKPPEIVAINPAPPESPKAGQRHPLPNEVVPMEQPIIEVPTVSN